MENTVASLLHDQKRYDDAEALYRQALATDQVRGRAASLQLEKAAIEQVRTALPGGDSFSEEG